MIGQLVTSKAGHDRGTLYVVTAQEGDFVYLCDGRLKHVESPKKKRRIHVQPINKTVDKELVRRLESGEDVRSEEIGYAIRQYLKTKTESARPAGAPGAL